MVLSNLGGTFGGTDGRRLLLESPLVHSDLVLKVLAERPFAGLALIPIADDQLGAQGHQQLAEFVFAPPVGRVHDVGVVQHHPDAPVGVGGAALDQHAGRRPDQLGTQLVVGGVLAPVAAQQRVVR